MYSWRSLLYSKVNTRPEAPTARERLKVIDPLPVPYHLTWLHHDWSLRQAKSQDHETDVRVVQNLSPMGEGLGEESGVELERIDISLVILGADSVAERLSDEELVFEFSELVIEGGAFGESDERKALGIDVDNDVVSVLHDAIHFDFHWVSVYI
jgi:hypothetical protein